MRAHLTRKSKQILHGDQTILEEISLHVGPSATPPAVPKRFFCDTIADARSVCGSHCWPT